MKDPATDKNNAPSDTGAAVRIPCGPGRQLLVMFYDAVAVVALLLLATAVALLAGSGPVTAGRDPVFTLYLVVVWFAYLGWCWTHGGMTLGMRAWRVVIEREDGSAPGWKHSGLRFSVSLLSALCLGLGFWWPLLSDRRRTWHDLASGTRLVRR
mgnify:CR=1 FL=1